MTRAWTTFLDVVDGIMSLPLAVLLLLAAAALLGVLWYFWPRWVPRRWPRLRFRRPSWRWPSFKGRFRWWRRKEKTDDAEDADDADDQTEAGAESDDAHEVPELPAETFISLADRYAAEGRYAEAIRERLRGIVRGLVERGVIEHRPGWTVTELAAAAAAARPEIGAPLNEAGRIFSDVWYGQQPADHSLDQRMRELAGTVTAPAPAGAAP